VDSCAWYSSLTYICSGSNYMCKLDAHKLNSRVYLTSSHHCIFFINLWVVIFRIYCSIVFTSWYNLTVVSCMLCWHCHCYGLSSACRFVTLLSHKDMYQYETQMAGLVHMPIKEISGCPMMMCPISEGRYVPWKFWVYCSGVIMGCDTGLLGEWLLAFWGRVHDEIICLWTLNTWHWWQHIPLKCVEPHTNWCTLHCRWPDLWNCCFTAPYLAEVIDWIPFGLFHYFVRIGRPCSIVGVVTHKLERVWKVKF